MDPSSLSPGSAATSGSVGQQGGGGGGGGGGGSDWGNMGGSPGDGFAGQQTNFGVVPQQAVTTPPYQSPPQQQQQPPASPYDAGSGSITRFATPDMQQQPGSMVASGGGGSYAARSQQAYAAGNYPQQQQQPYSPMVSQQQQQQQQQMGGSYASRSAQAYSQHQPQTMQQPQMQQSPPAVGGSYATRSAQAYGASPTVPAASSGSGGGSYASRSQQAYATQPQVVPVVQQQQQQQQPVAPAGAGSYASRSQQAYGGGQQQPPPINTGYQQPQPQPQPQSAASPTSYAARSAQAQQQGYQPQLQQQQGYQQQQQGYQQQSYQPQQQQQQQQQQPQQVYQQQPGGMGAPQQQYTSANASTVTGAASTTVRTVPFGQESPQAQAMQQRYLTDATRKVQEHAYYMRQAMDQKNLPVVLDRAAHMVGELGGPPHGQHHHPSSNTNTAAGPSNTGISAKLNPKNYYELYMRALEEMPTFEDYLLNLTQQHLNQNNNAATITIVESHHHAVRRAFTMRELYDCAQYCPRVVSRLYLQIAAGSALLRSGEAGAKWVLKDLEQAVRCEQNPIRGLFLRHYLLTALRDKLPDEPEPLPGAPNMETIQSEEAVEGNKLLQVDNNNDEQAKGTVKDSYEFILANFMEMNKLWVRIQHLPGEGKNLDVRKRRERERNELRILVGTNLVRLSQLECVTSKIYGEVILPQILDHISVCGDPLSQAYLMDCLVQVFPDEYHIETLPILLNVCPRLRDKVNIRTILQGLMDRLANYLAEEELLDESDTNQVKKALARDSFGLFEECVQKVYNARGPKLTSKEVIRLQTALLQFSIKCYPGNLSQINRCLGVCVTALRQANASYDNTVPDGTLANVPDDIMFRALDEASVAELEKLMSIPLDSLALKVLELEQYSDLLRFLPWSNRRQVAVSMLKAVDNAGSTPQSIKEIQELFSVIEPVIRDESGAAQSRGEELSTARATSLMAGLGVSTSPNTSFAYENEQQQPLQQQQQQDFVRETILVSKLVHLLDHEDPDILFEMLSVARNHICQGGRYRASHTLVAVVFASVKLAQRIFKLEVPVGSADKKDAPVDPNEEPGVTADKEAESQSTTEESGNVETAAPAEGETNGEDGKAESNESAETAAPAEGETNVDDGKAESNGSAETAVPGEDETNGKTEPLPVVASSEGAAQKSEENPPPTAEPQADGEMTAVRSTSSRKVFIFIQETIAMISQGNAETGVKLYLELSLTADSFSSVVYENSSVDATDFVSIAYELLTQAYTLYEETIADSKAQQRCIRLLVGTLLSSRSLSKDDFERFITKTAQFSAKVVKKPDQCQLVALCAHLFYPTDSLNSARYSNPQRALECLQRSLKLADACTSANPSNVQLFVDLLESYLFFFEKKNPVITHNYISGLLALIQEHIRNLESFESDSRVVSEAKGQFLEVVRYIKRKKIEEATAELFAPVLVDSISS